MKKRALCTVCNMKPVAVNYHKNGRTFFRTKCDSCIRKQKKQEFGRIPAQIKPDT